MKEQTIVCIPDLQIPYHSPKLVTNVIDFIDAFQPDALVNVGDDIDSPEVSRWSKGEAGEYAGTLQKAFDATREIHSRFRNALGDKPYRLSRSNHGDRLSKYISKYAPALSSLRGIRIEDLAGYKELGIEYHTKPFTIAPGWVCAHGDEGSLSGIPGKTALGLAQKWGTSVVCGHTHRAGIIPATYGLNGKSQTIYGMEVGNLMEMGKASYLSAGSANWQCAFGILRTWKGKTHPQVVYIQSDGSFVVDGTVFPEYTIQSKRANAMKSFEATMTKEMDEDFDYSS